MICILLVAGHSPLLELEIHNDPSGAYSHLAGIPKALLPTNTSGTTILDLWWEEVRRVCDCAHSNLCWRLALNKQIAGNVRSSWVEWMGW